MQFRSRKLLLLALVVLTVNDGCSSSETGASVFVVSSLQRILQDEVDINGDNKAEIFCAKGESESFQIIVLNKTGQTLPAIDLSLGNWSYKGDEPPQAIPTIKMFREHYVQLTRSSGRTKRKLGMYPDALVPFINPYTGRRITKAKYLASKHNVEPKSNQGYWIDITANRNITAGRYQNHISVTSKGEEIASVPVLVTVWDFEMPKVHKLKTYFGKMLDVSNYHGVRSSSLGYKNIVRRYLSMLNDHGAKLPIKTGPSINPETGQVSFTPEYVETLKSYTNEFQPSILRVILPYYSLSKDPTKRARYLSAWEAFIQQNPWIPEPIVYLDEPNSRDRYLDVLEYGKAIDAHAPSIKFLVTEQTRSQKPGWPSLEGAVDIWVPAWHLANPQDIRRRQKAGDEFWSYSALDHKGVPNWLIDFPLLDYRIPAWFSWSLDLKGILYWQTINWASKRVKSDPWTNCQTYSKGGEVWNGAGSLVYPGGEAGIDGPVASMRLKVFRDSIEDYDYFWVLSQRTEREKVNKIVREVASSFRVFSQDINKYVQTRTLIAENIIESNR